jgi:hypothetical protein
MSIGPTMWAKFALIAASIHSSSANFGAADVISVTQTSVKQRVFARFEAERHRMQSEHQASVANLEQTMTMNAAFKILKEKNATPALLQTIEPLIGNDRKGRGKTQKFLGLVATHKAAPTGYSGVDKARAVLNDMLNEVRTNYDTLTQKCSNAFEQYCAEMENCRSRISAANSAAALARERILAAQAEINRCEIELPRLKKALEESEMVCNETITGLNHDISIVMADIAVMTSVLEMTDCDADKKTMFAQVKAMTGARSSYIADNRIVKCDCKGHPVLQFRHKELRSKLAQVKSSALRQRIMQSMQTMAGEEPMLGMKLKGNVTNFTNPPLPQTEVPENPCEGISFDDADGSEKCSIATSPQCYKLQERFMQIQFGIQDEHAQLLAELDRTEKHCKETQELLSKEIEGVELKLSDQQTYLAAAMAEEQDAGETGREENKVHHDFETQMFSEREDCSVEMRRLESEECGLKKIRGEISRMSNVEDPFFQDCEMTEWQAEECSVPCGGGIQKLGRSVITQPYKGASCLPLEAEKGCNWEACPVNCKMEDWQGWSSCSAKCDGGVEQRVRPVTVHPKHDGEPCGETSETTGCAMQACNKDCKLADWSEWSTCSKECASGTTERVRVVLEAATGDGACPEESAAERFQEEKCNVHACFKKDPTLPMGCYSTMDAILIIDGSGSITQEGWDKSVSFAKKFANSFLQEYTDAKLSIILFSGPQTWSAWQYCSHEQLSKEEKEMFCGIQMIQHFSNDLAETQANIGKMVWPMATTLTFSALESAKTELSLSRPGVPTTVVLVTDGLPLSQLQTYYAAEELKANKDVRLMVVPVWMPEDGVELMWHMASWPKEENYVPIETITDLDSLSTMDTIIPDICNHPPNPKALAVGITKGAY